MKKKKNNCEHCKKEHDFYFHECKFSYHEYYGCKKCDNVCLKCSKEYAKRIGFILES